MQIILIDICTLSMFNLFIRQEHQKVGPFKIHFYKFTSLRANDLMEQITWKRGNNLFIIQLII